MWKWVFVLLLLANSLMFFWYAQQQPQSSVSQTPSSTTYGNIHAFELVQ